MRNAYKDLVVTDKNKKVKGYWETGDRESWDDRILMSEILPAYIEALDEEDGNNGFIIDLPDMLESMISIAEFFTPEEPERDDFSTTKHYFFNQRSERKALTALRAKHLAVLYAIQADVIKKMK